MKEAVCIVAVHDVGRREIRAGRAPGGQQVGAGKAMHEEIAELLLGGLVGMSQHRELVASRGKAL